MRVRFSLPAHLFARLKAGMIQEIKKLHENGVSWKRLESFGLEYKQIALYLQNKITPNSPFNKSSEYFFKKNILAKKQIIENIKTETWHFVKRQRTWFKRNKNIIWLNPIKKNTIIKVNNLIKKFL
ncbi:MAG: hypothetical protein ABH971_02545 [bacterium]